MVSFRSHLAAADRHVAPRNRAHLAGVVAIFFCSLCCGFAAGTNQVLDSWFAAQTNFHTFTAQVIQTRSLQVLSEPLVSTGKVWIAIPDRFRWEIGQPAQTIALRQPDSLFIIYPRLKRVEKYPLNDRQPGPWRDVLALLDASFPRSRAVMEGQFRVLSITQTNADWQVALQPRSTLARRLMAEIDICVRTNDFSLAATEMKFADGSRMRNDFTNIVVNSVLPEKCFDLKTDPDYTVVEPLRQ
jgi:outer membrane lipoprotein-sorting protein